MTIEVQINPLHIIGGPHGGTVSALAIAVDRRDQPLVFMGNSAGLFRATLKDGPTLEDCCRLPNAPLGIMALTASPQFAQDEWLIAGTDTGLYRSNDAGVSWQACPLPMSATILSLACSPNFATDGMVFAGTLEDGVWASQDRGRTWQARNFGLLDSAVFCIAVSANFAQDGIVFIGTDGALYHSYNGARAWKEASLDPESAPIISLAISPTFTSDGVVLAGSEQAGLFRSQDHGTSWDTATLPAQSINALIATASHAFIAATDAGLYRSPDAGRTWQCIGDIPHAVCLATHAQAPLAGLNRDGLAVLTQTGDWSLANTLPMRALSSLALSPHFKRDHIAYMAGPNEGLWRSVDGGRVWHDIGEAFPGDEVNALIAFPSNHGVALLAASPHDVLLSQDNGEQWRSIWEQPTQAIAASTHGIALADPSAIHTSSDLGAHWQTQPAPWSNNARVLALTLCDDTIGVAVLDADRLSLWLKTQTRWRQLAQHEVTDDQPSPQVRFYQPNAATGFVSIGHHIWRWDDETCVALNALDPSEEIIALAALHGHADRLLVCTHRRVLQVNATTPVGTTLAVAPTVLHDFGAARAVTFARSADEDENVLGYVVLLGGQLAALKINASVTV